MFDNIEMVIYLSCAVSTVMVVWFLTDAVYEYAKMLGFNSFFHVEGFEKQREINFDMNYPEYLSLINPSFFYRLLSCPFCLAFWLVLPLSLHFNIKLFFPVYLLSLITFFFVKRISSEWSYNTKVLLNLIQHWW